MKTGLTPSRKKARRPAKFDALVMNPKSFTHPASEAPLGAGTGVAARQHPSRTIFLTLRYGHWQAGGCRSQDGIRPAGF
ncbi:MAG: hypothetical protein ACREDS_00095 [Limisphaerales bacterium]